FLTGCKKNGCPDFLSVVSLAASSSASFFLGYSNSSTIWWELLKTPQTTFIRVTLAARDRDLVARGLGGAFGFFGFAFGLGFSSSSSSSPSPPSSSASEDSPSSSSSSSSDSSSSSVSSTSSSDLRRSAASLSARNARR